MKRSGIRFFGLIFFIIFFDQCLKIWIKTNLSVGEGVTVFPWFIIHFVENNGFAFGYEFLGEGGKLFLTFFRLIFAGFVLVWLLDSIRDNTRWITSFALSLIFAGASGNIIDSVFYGVFFDYAPLFFGRVVDMFYFPILSGTYPNWVPFWGGERFLFFKYVFNIADSAITVGAFLLLLFHNRISLK